MAMLLESEIEREYAELARQRERLRDLLDPGDDEETAA